jgi:nucleosome binding factor SPN SPT16 subunit
MISLADNRAVSLLEPLAKTNPNLVLIVREKANPSAAFATLKEHLADVKSLGYLPKDKYEGKFFTEAWETVKSCNVELVDATTAVATLLAPKDDAELVCFCFDPLHLLCRKT